MTPLSPGASRLAAVGLLVLLVFMLFVYLVVPVWSYYGDTVAEVALKRKQIQRLEYLLANEATIDEEIGLMERESSGGDLFLAGDKPAIASANLRELVTDAIQKSGGQLVSSQEYEAGAIAVITAIGLQLKVTGEVQNLIELVHALESTRPIIIVDELTITSSSSRASSSRSGQGKKTRAKKSSLSIEMSIVGYLAGVATDSAPGSESGGGVSGS